MSETAFVFLPGNVTTCHEQDVSGPFTFSLPWNLTSHIITNRLWVMLHLFCAGCLIRAHPMTNSKWVTFSYFSVTQSHGLKHVSDTIVYRQPDHFSLLTNRLSVKLLLLSIRQSHLILSHDQQVVSDAVPYFSHAVLPTHPMIDSM